jgi:UDP-N-acetylmuramoyl-tripeptide--D-alanyl-D-alanine ligase
MFLDAEILKEINCEIFGNWNNIKIHNISFKSKEIIKNSLFLALEGKKHNGLDFLDEAIERGASAAILPEKREINIPYILCKNVKEFLLEYSSKLWKKINKPKIAIMGSAGKTTLKNMIKDLFPYCSLSTRKSYNAAFSVAIESLKWKEHYSYFIYEIGIDRNGDVKEMCQYFPPDYVVFTTLGIEHTEFLQSVENIKREQYDVLNYVKNFAIVDEFYKDNLHKQVFSLKAEKQKDCYLLEMDGKSYNLPIMLNINGIIKAIQLGNYLKLDIKAMINKISNLQLINGRGNIIYLKNFKIFDHSYNSNPVSMHYVLEEINFKKEECIFIFGEMCELGHDSLKLHEEILETMEKNIYIKEIYLNFMHSKIQESYLNFMHSKIQENSRFKPLTYESFEELIRDNRTTLYMKGSSRALLKYILKALDYNYSN